MNQLYILLVGIASIAVASAAVGIFNQAHAQDNATMTTGNMTGGNATMTTGNITGGNATMTMGNQTIDDNATGQISRRTN